MWLSVALIVGMSYLLGSVPNGLLVGRARGIDIREHGSGNIGATNALRVLGRKWGLLVFALDFLKGLLAVRLAMWIAGAPAGIGPAAGGILAGIAVILGHNFPCWLRFKGGKGIATSGGVLVGLLPLVCAILVPIWLIVFYTTRYVSVASLTVAVGVPVSVLVMLITGYRTDWIMLPFSLAVGALAIWRHRENIQRLRAGTESRFQRKAKE